MYQSLSKRVAQHVEQQREHLEVVVLFIAHNVDHLIDGVVVEPHPGGADILSHVDRGAIGTQ